MFDIIWVVNVDENMLLMSIEFVVNVDRVISTQIADPGVVTSSFSCDMMCLLLFCQFQCHDFCSGNLVEKYQLVHTSKVQ